MRDALMNEHWFLIQVQKWALSTVHEDYCYIDQLGGKNSCQELVAYALARAIEDLEKRAGTDP